MAGSLRTGRRAALRFVRGLHVSVTGNAQAFGYSITITCVYGAVAAERGNPSTLSLLGFALSAVAGFTLLNLVVAAGLRHAPPHDESAKVLLIATSTDVFAVGLSVLAGIGVTHALTTGGAWLVAPFTATVLYVLVQAIEIAAGRAAGHEDRDEDEAAPH